MNDKQMQSNYIKIVGKIHSNLEFSHEVFGEKFYEFFIEVPRLSDTKDILPVIISERIINDINMDMGNYIVIEGQFRSYNRYEDAGNRLLLRIFVRDMYVPDENELEELKRHPNEVFLNGYLCKETKFRTTPFEKLEVGDHIKLWGRIQSRKYQKKNEHENYETKTAYEVSVTKLEHIKTENNRKKDDESEEL